MTRELLLAAAVLTACASPGNPPTRPSAVTASASASPPPASNPTGITSQGAARVAPLAPTWLSAAAADDGVQLTWPATGEDLAYYQCLRRTVTAGEWQPAARTTSEQHTCLDRNPANGTYIYGVQAVNAAGLASPITESQPITTG
jgi:hypothetical protein